MKKQLLNSQVGRINVGGVLFIEIGLVVAIIVITLVILSFNNMLSLNSILPQLKNLPFFPNNEKLTPAPRVTQLPISASLSFVSDIPEFAIAAPGQAEFQKLFKEWDIYPYLYSKDPKGKRVEEVVIHLTGVEQPYNKISHPNLGVILATDIKVQNAKADIYIYVSKSVLNSTSPQNPGDFLTSELLRTLYGVSHTANTQTEAAVKQKHTNTVILDFMTKNKNAVVITKK